MKDLMAITKGMDTYTQRHGGYTKEDEHLHQMRRALYCKYVYYNKSGKHFTTESESYMKRAEISATKRRSLYEHGNLSNPTQLPQPDIVRTNALQLLLFHRVPISRTKYLQIP